MIRSLEINNFRGFKNVKLDDLRRFTLVTGANASGKTALLEALFISGGNDFDIYLRTNAWRGKDVVPIAMSINELIPLIEDFFFQFDVENGIHIKFVDSNRGERDIRVIAVPQEILTLPFDKRAPEAVSPESHGLKFFWRTPEKEFEAEVESTPRGLRLAKPESTYFMMFLNNATTGSGSDIAIRYSQLSVRNQEKPIIDAVRTIFPYVAGISVETYGGNPMLHATVKNINRKVPIGLLSYGASKFAAILVGICSAPHGAVLIDEIENGWYYKSWPAMWQQITAIAEETKTQVVATTHSKEFLQCITPMVSDNPKDYGLIHTAKINGECKVREYSGREFATALEQGFEVR